MKTIKYAVAAVALSALSFGAFAVEPVSSTQAQDLNKIGVVSAEGATTLEWTLSSPPPFHQFETVPDLRNVKGHH